MQDDITQLTFLAETLNLCVNRTVDSDMDVVLWNVTSFDLHLDRRKQPAR